MNIREYLDKTKYTLKDLSEVLGVHEQYVWNISGGKSNPSARISQKISDWSKGEIKVYEIRKCTRNCTLGCPCSQRPPE